MPYNSEITAEDLSTAMTKPEVYLPIFQAAVNNSAAMTLATRLPDMSRGTRSLTVMNALPLAYWQATSTSLKQTTDAVWKNKSLVAEELAVIVPIAESLLADTENTGYDIWGEVTPRVGEAIGKLVDQAIFHGTNLPATWLTNTAGASASLLAGATAASHTVTEGTGTDLYDDIFGSAGALALVEMDGFDATGMVGPISAKGALRQVRADRTATGTGGPTLQPTPLATRAKRPRRSPLACNARRRRAGATR